MKETEKLDAESRRIFDKVRREWSIKDEPSLSILRVALEALSRLHEVQEQIRKDGVMMPDRFGQLKPHPLLQIEKESRAHFLMAMAKLDLDLTDVGGE